MGMLCLHVLALSVVSFPEGLRSQAEFALRQDPGKVGKDIGKTLRLSTSEWEVLPAKRSRTGAEGCLASGTAMGQLLINY